MSKLDRYGPWAVITGASDGIGLAIAELAAADGFNLVLAARNGERLRSLAGELERRHRVETRVVPVDLSQAAGPTALIDSTDGLAIGLAVLAAGFGTSGLFTEAETAEQLEMIAVNVAAVTQLAQAFARRMVAQRRGGIVLFGSMAGWQGVPGYSNYAATKAFVQTLAEGLHRELKPRGVDVLSVAPGPVHTGFADRAGMRMKSAATPEMVATAALNALGKKTTVIPGAQAKLLTTALSVLPRTIRSAMVGRAMGSMRA